ncbi:potassium transporter Kup [Corynebacterium anserum]|uniref:Probable potassium transport system protein Kup n=1 Tax=Corynebacterium anserum TaxID=2684406 RepID=A0A7G7YMD5_9CORY|nr:potassium transporter Kup [Corynebacterium anserum]
MNPIGVVFRSVSKTRSSTLALVIAALGVVFGDIGTSPLYAMQSIFALDGGVVETTQTNIYGVVSTIFWSLLVIVTTKYVGFILQADNGGEGGILALTALVERSVGRVNANGRRVGKARLIALMLGVCGAGLFYGDSVITPAISVMSAIEGVAVVNPDLSHWVVPLGALIIVALFVAQKWGTGAVGKAFGPIMVLWFSLLAVLGIAQIVQHPGVLAALLPTYALHFIITAPGIAFVAFGSIVLAITGAEALYADMGHFGKSPVRRAWLFMVFPSLVLNYLGQSALLVNTPEAKVKPFFLMAPSWAQLPLVIIATMATVIASQAVISGAFSVSKQAMNLGLLPRFSVRQTSSKEKGQIYLPAINWLLFVGVMLLLLIFRSSERLATAYGLAVTGTFLMTTGLFLMYARSVKNWAVWKLVVAALAFGTFEALFFSANAVKLFHGGWIPLTIGICIVFIMVTWRQGLRMLFERRMDITDNWNGFLTKVRAQQLVTVPGTAIYLHLNPLTPPQALETNVRFNHMIHERVVIIRGLTSSWPRVYDDRRVSVDTEFTDPNITLVTVRFGFFEAPNMPNAIKILRKEGVNIPDEPFYFTSKMSLIDGEESAMSSWRKKVFFFLYHNQAQPLSYFALPPKRTVAFESRLTL